MTQRKVLVLGPPQSFDELVADDLPAGSGLPPQWTDGGNGDVTAETDDDSTPLTVIAPESGADGPFAIRIEPAGPAWTGAIFVSTGDISGLMGNAYVLRVFDEVAGEQAFDLDSWGSMALRGASAGIQVSGGPPHPEILRALGSGEFKVSGVGASVLLSVDGRAGVDEVGFFGSQVIQQTAATLGGIYAALEAYGLLNAASGQPTPQTYTESNVTTDRAFNANATSIDELADVLGTLIADLRAQGVVA